MIVAIIPARGGSRRIPNKNIRLFLGKPMITYSIEEARNTGIFEKIIVSTDSYEIARIARDYGAEVPFMRPAELADDQTGTDAVIVHALNCLNEQNYSIRYVCCIYPTAPLMKAEFIRKGLELLVKHGAATAFSVTSFDYPIFRALKINDADRIEMFWPQYLETRSQDLPEAYHDAGQFYWADVKKYMKEQHFFSSDAVPVIIPQYLVQDIDTPEDWETAESMYVALQTRNKILF